MILAIIKKYVDTIRQVQKKAKTTVFMRHGTRASPPAIVFCRMVRGRPRLRYFFSQMGTRASPPAIFFFAGCEKYPCQRIIHRKAIKAHERHYHQVDSATYCRIILLYFFRKKIWLFLPCFVKNVYLCTVVLTGAAAGFLSCRRSREDGRTYRKDVVTAFYLRLC